MAGLTASLSSCALPLLAPLLPALDSGDETPLLFPPYLPVRRKFCSPIPLIPPVSGDLPAFLFRHDSPAVSSWAAKHL